jgi:hypothetical protein
MKKSLVLGFVHPDYIICETKEEKNGSSCDKCYLRYKCYTNNFLISEQELKTKVGAKK